MAKCVSKKYETREELSSTCILNKSYVKMACQRLILHSYITASIKKKQPELICFHGK